MGKNWGSFIRSGQVMIVGDYLTSPSSIFVAIAQGDSNFVIYPGTGPGNFDSNHPLWGFPNPPGGLHAERFDWKFILTDEAVLRILWRESSSAQSYWPNKQYPNRQYFAALEDDGNFAVYQGTGPSDKQQKMWETGNRDPVDHLDVSSIHYDIAAAKISNSGTSDLYRSTLHNDTDTQQSHTLHGSVTITETSGWSNALAVKIGAKTEFKAGFPVLAQGKVEISAEVTDTITWNASHSKAATYSFDQPLVIPPHKTYTAVVNATVSSLSVPYSLKATAVLKSGKTVDGVHSDGVYTGTNAHDWNVTIAEEKAPPHKDQVAVSRQELNVTRKVAPTE